MKTQLTFVSAAFFEIAGCYALWAVFRLGKSALWLGPGFLSLIAFAYLLTLAEPAHAGRTYAAYGGIYVVASIIWMVAVEKVVPDWWDLLGALLCVAGTLVITLGPRNA